MPKDCKQITVLDLLRHESGIPGTNYGDTSKDLKTAVRTMLAGGPQHDPGTKFEYWNQGYILLSEIVAKAARKPFTDFLRKEIFDPCGMSGTCFTGDSKPKGFVESTGSGELGPSRSCLEHPYGRMELVYQGTGGIVSNVIDMWKFHKALLGDDLLKDDFKELMLEPGDASQACGWFVRSATNGDTKRYNSGKVRGFCSDFRCFPETDSCVVVLANRDDAPSSMVANVIEGILLQPEVPGVSLDKAAEKKLVGEYQDSKGRILVVSKGEAGKPTRYMIYWQPKNPSAPISRGSVLKGKDGQTIFYQPGDPGVVELTQGDSGEKIESVEFKELKITFERFDIRAWSQRQKK